MNAGVIEQPTGSPRPRGKPSAAKSWLKAIELTSRIEANPDDCLPTLSRIGRHDNRIGPA